MRTTQSGGLCAVCGTERDSGAYWGNRAVVLDSGIPGDCPLEPDMSEPVRCDRCETLHRLHEDYRDRPALAQRMYGGATLADAIRVYQSNGWL